MGATVLIVDDYAAFRASARKALEEYGFAVVGEAADGTAAVASTEALRPDVLLLDVRLPDFDGFEVLRRLAAQGLRPDVVLTSSRDAADYGRRIAASGARGFIPKAEISGRAVAALLQG